VTFPWTLYSFESCVASKTCQQLVADCSDKRIHHEIYSVLCTVCSKLLVKLLNGLHTQLKMVNWSTQSCFTWKCHIHIHNDFIITKLIICWGEVNVKLHLYMLNAENISDLLWCMPRLICGGSSPHWVWDFFLRSSHFSCMFQTPCTHRPYTSLVGDIAFVETNRVFYVVLA